ncbi:hypothetical protein CMI42_00660 [Candidatus Pacearchaeota archaeon]|nr:hypothetical protein [Candidatus Pacearchaeota archaeon]|tara:strand:- start:919 stop:1287 length:369 start_codon:yes stop_codon:yes gene_type:complete
MPVKKLIFVYNANSGPFNSLADTLHKTFSPKTYKCNLCKITYGAFNMREDWREFINQLNIKTEFLHKDEFEKVYPGKKTDLPAILLNIDKKLQILLNTKEIESITDLNELKNLVKKRLNSNK